MAKGIIYAFRESHFRIRAANSSTSPRKTQFRYRQAAVLDGDRVPGCLPDENLPTNQPMGGGKIGGEFEGRLLYFG